MIPFLSNEELYFSWYCDELKEAGIIIDYTNDVKAISLTNGFNLEYIKPMKKIEDKIIPYNILSSRVYTPDFEIQWNPDNEFTKIFVTFIGIGVTNQNKISTPFISLKDYKSLIETKGEFDQNNMTRLFTQNQSWIYDKYGIYINLIKVPSIFKKTFTPDKYLLTDKSGKQRAIKFETKSLVKLINPKI